MASVARFMHTMIRVGDLERSVDFYQRYLGMREISHRDVTEGHYTNVFIGYGDDASAPMIEFTYSHGVNDREQGEGFGHLAIGVGYIDATCAAMRAGDVVIAREPGPVKFEKTIIAFVDDPDGYRIELIQ